MLDLKAPLLIAALVAAFAGGYTVADWRLTAQANAEALDRAQGAEKARDKAIQERDALAQNLAATNDQHTLDLRKAQDETNRLRDGLRDNAVGLRLAGTCPRPVTPQGAPGARVDSGTGAELGPTARRAYFALRDGIDRASAQLAACQDELRLRASDGSKSP